MVPSPGGATYRGRWDWRIDAIFPLFRRSGGQRAFYAAPPGLCKSERGTSGLRHWLKYSAAPRLACCKVGAAELRRLEGLAHTPPARGRDGCAPRAGESQPSALRLLTIQVIKVRHRRAARVTCTAPATGRRAAAAAGENGAAQQADKDEDDSEGFHGPPPASVEAFASRGDQPHPKPLRGVDSPHYFISTHSRRTDSSIDPAG